jgi:hypothetical protein
LVHRYPDPPPDLHHDVVADEETVAALWAEPIETDGRTRIFDRVALWRRRGERSGDLRLEDAVPYQPGVAVPTLYWEERHPGALDFYHANALDLHQGAVLVSLHTHDAVVALSLAPDTLGQRVWLMAGHPGSPAAPGDYIPRTPEGVPVTFRGQHHVDGHGDGTLTLFDNQRGDAEARALRLRLGAPPEAAVEEVWPVGQICPRMGSAFVTADGGMITTCADAPEILRLAPGASEPTGRLVPVCAEGPPAEPYVYRAEPVQAGPHLALPLPFHPPRSPL